MARDSEAPGSGGLALGAGRAPGLPPQPPPRPLGKNRPPEREEETPAEEPAIDLSRLSDDDYDQLKELHRRATPER
jgi:hypothetical protein